MSVQGIVIIDILGLGLIMLVFNLLRTHKLHVGYAVIWLLSIAGLMVIISIPRLLSTIPIVVGAVFPASALSLFAFIFIFLLLIFITMQLSTLSARQTEIVQALAVNELLAQEEQTSSEVEDTEHFEEILTG